MGVPTVVVSLVDIVSADPQLTQTNGDGLEGKDERVSGEELRGPWVCTKRWRPQRMEGGWKVGLLSAVCGRMESR